MKTKTFDEKVKDAGSLKNYWTNQAKDNLVGAKIIKVEYMEQEVLDTMMWYKSPLCMLLEKDNKRFWVYPSMDDEGNDGGALFTSLEKYSTAPTL